MNNEIKKLSRNRKRRYEGKVKMVNKMKSLLSKIKYERKRKIKILIQLKN